MMATNGGRAAMMVFPGVRPTKCPTGADPEGGDVIHRDRLAVDAIADPAVVLRVPGSLLDVLLFPMAALGIATFATWRLRFSHQHTHG